jgi:hypothetical protein
MTEPSAPDDEPRAAPPPATRTSDAEREAAATRLRDAAAEGRLDLEELAERLAAAYGATTRAELEPLTADLPAAAAPAAPAERRSWLVGIFGGEDRKGRWRPAREIRVLNVFGGCDLDLRGAEVQGELIDITVFSLFGGSDIVVPEGVPVEMGGFALLGGNDLDVSDAPPVPGAPLVRVRAYSLFGGTDVVTRRERGRPRHPRPPPPPVPPAPPPPPLPPRA